MNLVLGQEERCRLREQTCGHSGEGQGRKHWEMSLDINTPPCVKEIASGEALHGGRDRELSSALG